MQPIIFSWMNYLVIQNLDRIINRKRVVLVILLKLCWLTEGMRLRDAQDQTPDTVIYSRSPGRETRSGGGGKQTRA